MEAFFVKIFWTTVTMLWIALLILYVIFTNKNILKRKGHNKKYIAYLRRSHTIRIVITAILLPLLILLSAWIISLITGPLNQEVQVGYIVLLLILLVSPFKFLDEYLNQKKIRKLALETKEKVAVDLNYKVLHQIFNPILELVLGPLTFLYGFFYLKIEVWVIYLFLLFPWFMYLHLRGTRYQTRPYLKDNYIYTFSFNIFNFLFFLFYFIMYFLKKVPQVSVNSPGPGSNVLLLAGMILILGHTIRTAIYLANYRAFKQAVTGESNSLHTARGRKLVFALSGVILVTVLTGITGFSGIIENTRIDVGTVQQKYILQDQKDHCDTLLIVDRFFSMDGNDFERYLSMDDIKLSCKVVISKTGQQKTYDVCCPSTFKELTVGQIVKFEYSPGPTIQKILE